MKKVTLSLALMAGSMLLTGCGSSSSVLGTVGSAVLNNALGTGTSSSSSSSSSSSTGSLLGNLLSNVLGSSSSISQSDLVGTWNYKGADCVFESENLLAKAGGAVAASKIESQLDTQLSKVGIKEGSCSYTFNKDNTFTATIGGRTLNGTYTLNSSDKTIKMSYLAGLASFNCNVVKSGNTISLLMDSDKMLTLLKGASALTKNTSIGTLTSLLSNYNGMKIGMKMSK